jgi:hypothetical protein
MRVYVYRIQGAREGGSEARTIIPAARVMPADQTESREIARRSKVEKS